MKKGIRQTHISIMELPKKYNCRGQSKHGHRSNKRMEAFALLSY